MDNYSDFPVAPLLGMSSRYQEPVAGSASVVQDMVWDPRGCWQRSHGYTQEVVTQNASAVDREVSSMFWFESDFGGRRWLLWEQGPESNLGSLRYLDGLTGNSVELASDRYFSSGAWQGSQYMVVDDTCYIINGRNQPVRFHPTGRYLATAGFQAEPGPPIVDDRSTDAADVAGDEFGMFVDRLATANNGTLGRFYRGFGLKYQKGVGDRYPDTSSALSADPVAAYGYCLTYINDLGQESPPSRVVFAEAQSFPTSGRRTVVLYLEQPPKNVRAIRIWRTVNLTPNQYQYDTTGALWGRFPFSRPALPEPQFLQEQRLYLLDTLGPSGPAQYADQKDDSELGIELDRDAVGVWPTSAKFMAFFGGRLWLAGMDDEPSTLRFSHPLYREQFPDINRVVVSMARSGRVTGLVAEGNRLLVFTTRGIYQVIPYDSGAGFRTLTVTEDVGASASNCFLKVPGAGLTFMNESGIWLLSGNDYSLLSGPVQDVWDERVFTGGVLWAHAFLNRGDKEIWFQVPADGNARPSLGLVYHYAVGQWSTRVDYPASRFIETSDERAVVYMASWDTTTDPGIHIYGAGSANKGASTFNGKYITHWIPLDYEYGRRRVMRVEARTLGYGTGRTLTFKWRKDRSLTYEDPAPSVLQDHFEAESEWKMWGESVFDSGDTWLDYVPAVLPVDVTDTKANIGMLVKEIQLKFESNRVGLMGFNLRLARQKSMNVHTLNSAATVTTE